MMDIWVIVEFAVDLMFVEGMAAFMDQRIDGCCDVMFIIIRRDTHIISREAIGERVFRQAHITPVR